MVVAAGIERSVQCYCKRTFYHYATNPASKIMFNNEFKTKESDPMTDFYECKFNLGDDLKTFIEKKKVNTVTVTYIAR